MLIALTFLLFSLPAFAADTVSWPQFRGPQEGQVEALPSEPFGLAVAWSIEIGSGYSGISIADGRVYTAFTSGAVDVLAAFATDSGAEVWRYDLGERYAGHDGSADGPLSTVTVHEGVVYFVSARGLVVAVNATDGTLEWDFQLDAENSTVPFYGYTTSPLVTGDSVILATGGEGHSVTALDRYTGEPKWTVGDDSVLYQTPSLVPWQGRQVLVAVTDHDLQGIDPISGEFLWQLRHTEGDQAQESAHVTPYEGGKFLVDYEAGSKLYQLTATDAELVWESRAFGNSLGIPVLVGDHFYGFSRAILTCVEADTGKIVWRSREPGGGGVSRVGNALAILAPGGSLVLADASPDGYREITRQDVLADISTHFPSYASGHFLVRNLHQMAAVRVDAALTVEEPPVLTTELIGEFGRWIESLNALPERERMGRVDQYFLDKPTTPLIEADGSVHFVWRGDAEDIGVGGDALGNRETSLRRVAGTDLFFHSVKLHPAGQYNYTVSVDFEASIVDPSNPHSTDLGFSVTSDLRMPEWPESPHLEQPDSDMPRGSLDSFPFRSAALGNTRQIQVWRPADYDQAGAYPLLVVNHGDNQVRGSLMANTLDNMVGKALEPLVAVFVPRVGAAEYGGEDSDRYSRFLVEELLPHLRRHYSLKDGPSTIMGPGSAGVAALYTSLMHPGVFDQVAVQSYYPIEPAHAQIEQLLRSSDSTKPEAVFVVYSNRDYPNSAESSQALLLGLEEASVGTESMVTEYTPLWGGWRGQHDEILIHFFGRTEGTEGDN